MSGEAFDLFQYTTVKETNTAYISSSQRKLLGAFSDNVIKLPFVDHAEIAIHFMQA